MKEETATWTKEEIQKNLSEDEQAALMFLLRKAKNGAEVPPEAGSVADLSRNEDLIRRLKTLLRDPGTPDDVKQKIRELLGIQNKALKELLDQHSKTQTQPTKKSWMNPMNIDATSLMNKSIEELQREAGWTKVNPAITDPDQKSYELIESMRKSNPSMDGLCKNILAGQMPSDEILRKLNFEDIGHLERWRRYHSFLKRQIDNSNLIQKKNPEDLTPEEKAKLLEGQPIQKRGLVHSQPIKEYRSPLDFTHKELLTLSPEQLLRKAGFRRFNE